MMGPRSKPWKITITIQPEDIDRVRALYAYHTCQKASQVNRATIASWFENIVDSYLEKTGVTWAQMK